MNKLIEIQDLQVGDEILVPSMSNLMYLRVLRPVKLQKNKLRNRRGNILYSSVYCSFKRDRKQYTTTWGQNAQTYTYYKNEYDCTPLNHNMEGYKDLNYKTIWLVKR